ncbi:MAG: hypothetical protein ACK5M3_15945 [Dysgonomonas sp.]
MIVNDFTKVFEKVTAIRAENKANLKGIELMHYNLYWKLRGWMMRETNYRCVSVCDVIDKIKIYAPKTILKNRKQFEKAVKDLWRAGHDYDIDSEESLCEDLEYWMDYEFEDKTIIMNVTEQFIGKKCQISGDLQNGFMNGKPYIGYDDVVRVIRHVNDTHVICECGRKFLNNQNLKIEEL